jgi:hypothetical protein
LDTPNKRSIGSLRSYLALKSDGVSAVAMKNLSFDAVDQNEQDEQKAVASISTDSQLKEIDPPTQKPRLS